MAGLELLYTSVAGGIRSPQDAIVCCVHWEIIKSGCRCIGSGDESRSTDRRSELLPTDWNSSNELYTLRYETPGTNRQPLLLKAVLVDSCLFLNLMNRTTQQLSEMTVNIDDHVNAEQLQSYDSAYKDAEHLTELVRTQLLPSQDKPAGQRSNTKRSVEDDEVQSQRDEDSNPLRNPSRNIGRGSHSHWTEPRPNPFAVGGEDLNPFGSHGHGGMILDPLRSGFPRSGIDPSSGIPDILPPGAVPPGARFDPFGPIGRRRPGPDPDHMPPPGYDDMFM